METHNIKIKASQLISVQQAVMGIRGDRPIMLAYKLAQLLKPVDEMHQQFIERARPHFDEKGEVKEGHEDEAENIFNEELDIDVPVISIDDLVSAESLTVPDDSVLMFLVDIGVLTEPRA